MEFIQNGRGCENLLTVGGVTHTLQEWSNMTGITANTLMYRIKEQWSEEAIFRKPEKSGRRGHAIKSRGCTYCDDFERNDNKCPHRSCPYHELDGFKTYEEYMKKSKKDCFAKLLDSLG